MFPPLTRSRFRAAQGLTRRGSALLVVLLLTIALSALALSAIALASNATVLARSYERETDLRLAADAALAMGKSRLNKDSTFFPDSGYVTVMASETMLGADGLPVPGANISLYVGPSGSTTGQFGTFASIITEARDARGSAVIRRLELSQESFAKWAYWTNREETASGGTISFGGGDNLTGPVWSNDDINILSSGATFFSEVGTAGRISGKNFGTFRHNPRYQEMQQRIPLPPNSKLAKLAGYAASGNLAFTPLTAGGTNETNVRMRLEFVAIDLNADGDSTDSDEGFVRVYDLTAAGTPAWLRGDYRPENCGDWHYTTDTPNSHRFFPHVVHNDAWFQGLITVLVPARMTAVQANNESAATNQTVMTHPRVFGVGTYPTPRCFLGGDPRLIGTERGGQPDGQRGGTEQSFYPVGAQGTWRVYPGAVDPRVTAVRPLDAAYLFPLGRELNPGSKGVIHVNGTVGISGVVRGRLTLYATGTIVILDDLRYSSDPGAGPCNDMLGLIAARNVTVADNALLAPKDIDPSGTTRLRNLDETQDLFLHGVIMALNTSFDVQNYADPPNAFNNCGASKSGRGCLHLLGGIIQERRGAVGQVSGGGINGYVKRYSYDRCALQTPPPYFPTTGRFLESRYVEIDPKGFDIDAYFAAISSIGQ